MILAAGEGRRMRPLTLNTPKPLLEVKGVPLIVYHIQNLVQVGITDIVINVAYLGDKIEAALGNGSQWGAHLTYSHEPQALETAGAIYQALPLLGSTPFLLVNGDVWLPDGFSRILSNASVVFEGTCLGVLALVENPGHNNKGDFSLKKGRVGDVIPSEQSLTFSGVSLLSPKLIQSYPDVRERFALKEVFDWAISQSQLKGCVLNDVWVDVGTPERLKALQCQ